MILELNIVYLDKGRLAVDRSHLESQLAKDYELLKELEDSLRVEDYIKRQKRLELDIES